MSDELKPITHHPSPITQKLSLHIYNTLTRRKDLFVPLNPPRVTMYVCGVTVYDYCHLGHARALINFDVIFRYLKQKGYEVCFVRNYTDVDDKIIKRAAEDKISWSEVAGKYIASFDEDMKALGNQKPTFEPKATENVEDMQKIIKILMEKGYAYPAGGDIFYSVRKKGDYGKLSGKKIDELEAGARVEIHEEKKDPLDFCLWKSSKPGPKGAPWPKAPLWGGGEPSWESPWGPGRPGWHIECSAMSMRFLGETIDIHGGGRDLSFPHHENEIAQSESASGKMFARFWIHNGFVNINEEKMSKSLGNFLTIRDLLKTHHPEVVRSFVLSAHYRSSLDYTEQNLIQARQSLDRWYQTMARVMSHCGSAKKTKLTGAEENLAIRVTRLYADFSDAMDDDFNTAKVFGLLFDLLRAWNKILDEQKSVCSSVCHLFITTIQKIHEVLGLFGSNPQVYLDTAADNFLKKSALDPAFIDQQIQKRNQARREKDWASADKIRQSLLSAGVQLKDNPDGTTSWSVVS